MNENNLQNNLQNLQNLSHDHGTEESVVTSRLKRRDFPRKRHYSSIIGELNNSPTTRKRKKFNGVIDSRSWWRDVHFAHVSPQQLTQITSQNNQNNSNFSSKTSKNSKNAKNSKRNKTNGQNFNVGHYWDFSHLTDALIDASDPLGIQSNHVFIFGTVEKQVIAVENCSLSSSLSNSVEGDVKNLSSSKIVVATRGGVTKSVENGNGENGENREMREDDVQLLTIPVLVVVVVTSSSDCDDDDENGNEKSMMNHVLLPSSSSPSCENGKNGKISMKNGENSAKSNTNEKKKIYIKKRPSKSDVMKTTSSANDGNNVEKATTANDGNANGENLHNKLDDRIVPMKNLKLEWKTMRHGPNAPKSISFLHNAQRQRVASSRHKDESGDLIEKVCKNGKSAKNGKNGKIVDDSDGNNDDHGDENEANLSPCPLFIRPRLYMRAGENDDENEQRQILSNRDAEKQVEHDEHRIRFHFSYHSSSKHCLLTYRVNRDQVTDWISRQSRHYSLNESDTRRLQVKLGQKINEYHERHSIVRSWLDRMTPCEISRANDMRLYKFYPQLHEFFPLDYCHDDDDDDDEEQNLENDENHVMAKKRKTRVQISKSLNMVHMGTAHQVYCYASWEPMDALFCRESKFNTRVLVLNTLLEMSDTPPPTISLENDHNNKKAGKPKITRCTRTTTITNGSSSDSGSSSSDGSGSGSKSSNNGSNGNSSSSGGGGGVRASLWRELQFGHKQYVQGRIRLKDDLELDHSGRCGYIDSMAAAGMAFMKAFKRKNVTRLFPGKSASSTRLLFAGLGVGALPNIFMRMFPQVTIDVVEIDPVVAEAAEELFGFDPHKCNLFIEDINDFLDRRLKEQPQELVSNVKTKTKDRAAQKHKPVRYDAIFLDVADEDGLPKDLVTVDFLNKLSSVMHPENSVLVTNVFVPKKRNFRSILHTFDQCFQSVHWLACRECASNQIVVSYNMEAIPEDELIEKSINLQEQFDFNFWEVLNYGIVRGQLSAEVVTQDEAAVAAEGEELQNDDEAS